MVGDRSPLSRRDDVAGPVAHLLRRVGAVCRRLLIGNGERDSLLGAMGR